MMRSSVIYKEPVLSIQVSSKVAIEEGISTYGYSINLLTGEI
jgi:hypothetical protein